MAGYFPLWSQITLAVATVIFWQLYRWRLGGSVLHNIPGPPNKSFWTGNIKQFYLRHGSEFHKDVAFNYGTVAKIHGVLGRPMLYVSDPKALQTIIIKGEQTFEESSLFLSNSFLLFGPGLLSTLGDKHRKQRKLLNPVFSINHMRHMLPIFYNVVHKLRDGISSQIAAGHQEVDVLNWMGRTALELIGQGGLGYSFDPLIEEKENDYGDALKALQPNLQKIALYRRAVPYVYHLGPAWFRRFVMDIYPVQQIRKVKSIVDSMYESSINIFRAKQIALAQGDEAVLRQVGEGKDLMSILIKANSKSSEADKLAEDELISQMSTFVFAATDTTSNALARILEQLAEHPDVQQKLREEILEANADDYVSYDALDALPLLDAVCRETLRVFPPATIVTRVPNKDSVLPLSEPITGLDGTVMTEIPLPKGTEVFIGILGSNASKARWGDDAWEWKPERWLKPLPKTVTEDPVPGVYSNLMTFLGGRRACIGFKFSEMEMKVVLAVLLSTFTFELSGKPIVWNVAGVRYPTVGKESNLAQLPLKVALYKRPHV